MARILVILLLLQLFQMGGSWMEVPSAPQLEGQPVQVILHSPFPDGSRVYVSVTEGEATPASGILEGGEFKFNVTIAPHEGPLYLGTALISVKVVFGPLAEVISASVPFIGGSFELLGASYHAQPLAIYDHEGGFYHPLYEPWCHITSLYMALVNLFPDFNDLLYGRYSGWVDHRGDPLPSRDPYFYHPRTTYPVLEFIQLRYLGRIAGDQGLKYYHLMGILENVSQDLGLELGFSVVDHSQLEEGDIAVAAVRLWGGHYVMIRVSAGGMIYVFDPSLLEPMGYSGVGQVQYLDPLRTWLLRAVLKSLQQNGTIPEWERSIGLYVVREEWLDSALIDGTVLVVTKI